MKKYFRVEAKGGHVGRSKYILLDIYVIAESKSDAARIVRYTPRVKHDHKDAILAVENISRRDYIAGKRRMDANPYFTCHDASSQKAISLDYMDRIFDEPRREAIERTPSNCYKGNGARIRDIYKFRKLNNIYA